MTTMTLEQEIAHVTELRAEKERTAKIADAAKRAYDEAEFALWERMDATGVSSVGMRGTMYSAKSTVYGTVQDKAALRRWAVDEGNAPELFEPEPRAALINERARQSIDNGEALPPGVGWYTKSYVSQTKQ